MIKVKHFHSKDCLPCEEMQPEIRKLKKSNKRIKVEKIDVDTVEGNQRAENERVKITPTTIIEKNNNKTTIKGFASHSKLKKLINEM